MNKKIKQITVVILIIILSQIILISDMGNGSSTTMDTILQIIYIISVMIINFVTWKVVTYNSEDNKKKKIIKCIIEIAFLSIAFFLLNYTLITWYLRLSIIGLSIYKTIEYKEKNCNKENFIVDIGINVAFFIITCVLTLLYENLYVVWTNIYVYVEIILSGIAILCLYKIYFVNILKNIYKPALIIFLILLFIVIIFDLTIIINISLKNETYKNYCDESSQAINRLSDFQKIQNEYFEKTKNYGNVNSIMEYNKIIGYGSSIIKTNYELFETSNSTYFQNGKEYIENTLYIINLYIHLLNQIKIGLIINFLFIYIIAFNIVKLYKK